MENGNNQDKDKKLKQTGESIQVAGELLTISTTLLSGVLIGYFSGDYLDKKFNTFPWLTISMLILGIAAAFKSVFTTLSKKGGS